METKLVILILMVISISGLYASLSDSLVAYYPFNGNANDESGNEHNGTTFGPSLTYDRFGNENSAYEFDGTNDYIALDMHYANGDTLDKFTFVGWYKTSFSSSGYSSNWSFFDFDRSEWFNFYIRGDNGKLAFSGADGVNGNFDIYADTASNDGQWHQGVVIYDSDNNHVKFYLDGNLDGVSTFTNTVPITDTFTKYGFIGDGSEATSFNGPRNNIYYDGAIDDIRFYNRILTEDEIHELYFQSNFTASRTVASIGDSIQFTAISYGNPTSWEWDFDHDSVIDSYEQAPTWSYSALGSYTVSLTISDGVITNTTTKEDFILITENPLETGLFAYYPFNGNADDESGNDHNGTTYGPELSEDRFSNIESAYSFDGSNDYIHLLTDEQADSLGIYFSVSVWFKSTSADGDSEARVITRDRSDYWAIFVNQTQSFPQDMEIRVDSGTDYTIQDIIEENTWYMVTITWDLASYEAKLYFDRELLYTYAFAGFSGSSRPVILGVNTEENPNPNITQFAGKIDDVRLYNRILVHEEVREIYHEHAWPIFPDFTATPIFGAAPFEVTFTDLSRNASQWEWDFENDGIIDSYDQNPLFIYTIPDIYDVKLIATYETITDTIIKYNYIVVQDSSLSAPQNPIITLSNSDVILNWDPVVGADYYLIYCANIPYTTFEYLDFTDNITTYTHTDIISQSNKHFYKVIGFDGSITRLYELINQNSEITLPVNDKNCEK